MKKSLFLFILFVCSLVAYPQSKLSNYTRSFLLDTQHETRDMRREAQSTQDVISALSGQIGNLDGVTVKTAYSNVTSDE